MATLQYQCSMSLDGFIAGPGGDMSWLAERVGEPNPMVGEVMRQTGALLVGRRTFGGDDPHKGTEHEGEAYGGGWDGAQFVLTHRIPEEPMAGVTFVGDLGSGVEQAKAAAGDGIVGVLGASVAGQCIDAGLLDEIWVAIEPVLLGAGVRLFDRPGGAGVELERIRLDEAPGVTNLVLRVVR